MDKWGGQRGLKDTINEAPVIILRGDGGLAKSLEEVVRAQLSHQFSGLGSRLSPREAQCHHLGNGAATTRRARP